MHRHTRDTRYKVHEDTTIQLLLLQVVLRLVLLLWILCPGWISGGFVAAELAAVDCHQHGRGGQGCSSGGEGCDSFSCNAAVVPSLSLTSEIIATLEAAAVVVITQNSVGVLLMLLQFAALLSQVAFCSHVNIYYCCCCCHCYRCSCFSSWSYDQASTLG